MNVLDGEDQGSQAARVHADPTQEVEGAGPDRNRG
jgi:hypothetical protein